jgi:hypothetical protein
MKGHKDHEERMHHKGEHRMHRARGGGIADMEERPEEHTGASIKREEESEGEKMLHPHKHDGKKRDHEKLPVKKKSGGAVHGKHPGHRLDKRARGGRLKGAEHSPLSEAHKMSSLPYEKDQLEVESHGEGPASSMGKKRD